MEFENTENHPIDWLRQEYAQRRRANPQYSLRAFAKFLEIPSGRLSELFEGKRQLTAYLGEKLAGKLGLTPELTNSFLELISQHRKDERRKPLPQSPDGISRQGASVKYHQLSIDAFYAIADWEHYAILSLMETRNFISDTTWIAQRLGISPTEVRMALERLERLGLVDMTEGRWKPSTDGVTTTHEVPASAVRKSHKQSLEQAIIALDDVPLELRDITSITMAINVKRLPEAKKLIRDFRRGLSKFLEEGHRDEVYNLNIQLVPVTKVSP